MINKYRLLGVIDWEGACFRGLVGDRRRVSIDTIYEVLPPVIDVPWNYHDSGVSRNVKDRQWLVELVVEQENLNIKSADTRLKQSDLR